MTEQIPRERFERLADPVAPDSAAATSPTAQTPPPAGRKRAVLGVLLSAAALAGLWYGYRYVTEGRFLVSTDDAYVKADVATISAKVGGNLVGVPVVLGGFRDQGC